MARYIAQVMGLTNVGALWFDSATTYDEMVRDMAAVSCADPRVIFVKLFKVRKFTFEDTGNEMAYVYLYTGVPDTEKRDFVQHFFYARSQAEALEAANVWSWGDAVLYACTEIKQ